MKVSISPHRVLFISLIGLYPLVAHLSVLVGQMEIAVAWLIVLGAWWLGQKQVYWLAGGLVVIALGGFFLLRHLVAVLYWPPLLVNFGLLLYFAYSLLPGQTPVATYYAGLIRGLPLPPRIERYTRYVTIMWCIFFAILTLESVLLPLYASVEIWSLFNNMLNYLFIVAVFILEYLARRYYFLPDVPHIGFLAFSRRMIQLRYSGHASTTKCK